MSRPPSSSATQDRSLREWAESLRRACDLRKLDKSDPSNGFTFYSSWGRWNEVADALLSVPSESGLPSLLQRAAKKLRELEGEYPTLDLEVSNLADEIEAALKDAAPQASGAKTVSREATPAVAAPFADTLDVMSGKRAHSKSEYKRLTAQGADVLPPSAARFATPAENMEVLYARLHEHMSPAEQRELQEVIGILQSAPSSEAVSFDESFGELLKRPLPVVVVDAIKNGPSPAEKHHESFAERIARLAYAMGAWFPQAQTKLDANAQVSHTDQTRNIAIEECARMVDEYNEQSETGDTLTMLAENMRALKGTFALPAAARTFDDIPAADADYIIAKLEQRVLPQHGGKGDPAHWTNLTEGDSAMPRGSATNTIKR